MPWGLPFPSFSSRTDENSNAEVEGGPAATPRHRPVPIQTSLPDDQARREERLRAADEARVRANESRVLTIVARDRSLREQAPDRWQPDINPNSDEFSAILDYFTSRLKDEHDTLDNILSEELAPHERALLTPVDRADNAPLAAIQARNTALYSELLRSQRFQDWAPRADLAFKLTLVFFGLPVAPMRLSSSQAWKGLAEQSGWEDELLIPQEDEEPSNGRLRFLNEYWVRMYEQDGLRHPDPILEAYYAYHRLREVGPAQQMMDQLRGPEHRVSLALRGGGGDDDDDASEFWTDAAPDVSMKETNDIHDADDGDLSLRGGSGEEETSLRGVLGRVQRVATIKDPSQQRSQFSLSEFEEDDNEFWVPMRGFMGIVWFNVFSLYSYVDAVDRLLCLDNRAGITYNIYLFDRGKDYTSRKEQQKLLNGDPESGMSVTCAGVGDYSHDDLAHTAILDRFLRELSSEGDVDATVIFISAPSDPIPLVWEPAKDHRVIKLTLEWPNVPVLDRLDVAYVRVPPEYKASSHHYSNYFGLWMARACRVLGVGRSPLRPGRPTVPDAFFALKGENSSSSFGGLSFSSDMWREIMKRWERDESQPITLVAQTPSPDGEGGEDEQTDRWNFFVPGYNASFNDKTQKYLLFTETPNSEAVYQRIHDLMRASLSDSVFRQLKAVEVYLPGDTFFAEASTAAPIHRVPMTYNASNPKVKDDQKVLRDSLQLWLDSLASSDATLDELQGIDAFSTFIALRPIFLQYSIWGGGLSRISWRPDETSLDEFYRLATKASSAAERKQFRNGTARLAITQGKDDPDSLKKPQFLITPLTSESEWRQIAKQIVDPDVTVRWVKGRGHEPQDVDIELRQPFGFRDTYEPPLSFVYPQLEEGGYPDVTHHKDWQMLAEDVSEDLGTIQPWEHQPLTPPGPIGSEGCPVRPLDFGAPITAKMAQVVAVDSPFSSEGMDTPQTSEPVDTPQSSEARNLPVPPTAPGVDASLADDADDFDEAGEAEDFDVDNEPGEQSDAIAPQDPPQDPPRPARPPVARRLFPKSDMDKAAEKRRYSYIHPVSVHTEGNIPIHAPPVERLLRPPTESLPVVPQAFLTPTEVRQLQRDYFDMRSIILRRSVQCNYAGCPAVFPANHPERMDRHLRDCHVSWGCNFCDELLYKHWPPEQKVQHYLDNHADYLEVLHGMNKNQNAGANAAAASDPDPDDPGPAAEDPFVSRVRSASTGSAALSGKVGSSPLRRGRTGSGSGAFIDSSDIGIALSGQASSLRRTGTGAPGASQEATGTIPGLTHPHKATPGGSIDSRNRGSTQPGPARSPKAVRPGTPKPAPAPTQEPSTGHSPPSQRILDMFSGPRLPRRAGTRPPKVDVTRPQEVDTRRQKAHPRPPNVDTTTPTPAPAPTSTPATGPATPRAGERLWRFCARCGRDHSLLSAPADRAHHDKVCHPGNPLGAFCTKCGARNPAGETPHVHRSMRPSRETFCPSCGLGDRLLEEGYRATHGGNCPPLGPGGEVEFCPWCGKKLALGGDGAKHVGRCPERVVGEEEEGEEGGKGKGKGRWVDVVIRPKAAAAMAAAAAAATPGKRKAAAGGNTGSGRAKRNKVTFPEGEASERYFRAEEPPSELS